MSNIFYSFTEFIKRNNIYTLFFSPFKIIVILLHIIYVFIIYFLWNYDKVLLVTVNYYICVVFQITISAFLIYKFNPFYTQLNHLNSNDIILIFTIAITLIYLSLTTGIIGNYIQSLINENTPYNVNITNCH